MLGRKKPSQQIAENIDTEEGKIRAYRLAQELANLAATLQSKASELAKELTDGRT